MPFTPTNWSAYESGPYNNMDILEDALQGYKKAREPYKIKQEEQHREFTNRLLKEQGTHAEQENYFYPQLQTQQVETGRLNLENLPTEIRDKNELATLTNAEKRQSNLVHKLFDIPKEQADLIVKQQAGRTAQIQNQTLGRNNELDILGKEADNAKKQREFENPGLEYGNQEAKLREVAADALRAGDPEKAELYNKMADEEKLIQQLKSQKTAGKTVLTPEEEGKKAFEVQKAKEQAKDISKANERLEIATKLNTTAQHLKELVKDPLFGAAVGPLDNWVLPMFAETKKYHSELKHALGRSEAEMTDFFKGTTHKGILKFIKDIGADISDREASVQGYINAVDNLSDIAKKQGEIVSELTTKGVPYHKAMSEAERLVPIPSRADVKKSRAASNQKLLTGTDKDGNIVKNILPENRKYFEQMGGTING